MINGIPMKLDYSKTLNDQHETFEYYKNRYISYELQIIQLNKRIAYLERSLDRKEETITELELERVPYTNEYVEKVKEENEELKEQLEHCYCNRTDCSSRIKDSQRYDSLQQENEELKKLLEEKEEIACNWKDSCLENAGKIEKTENQQQEFIKYLKSINSFETIGNILSKYKEIIGTDTNVGSKGE